MREQLLIETDPNHGPEKSWLYQVLLDELLGLTFTVRAVQGVNGHRITLPNGRHLLLEDHFFRYLPESQYLEQLTPPAGATRLDHPFKPGKDLIILYGQPDVQVAEETIHCHADLMASAFFMLSRWEEYGREQHGRFPADAALACRSDFIERPVVNEYAAFLNACLTHLGMDLHYPVRKARLHLSCDVDHPRLWARPGDRLRTLAGSLLLRRSVPEFLYWINGPMWKKSDPFDVFDDWMDMAEATQNAWHFNFMAGREFTSDCNYSLHEPFLQKLIIRIHERGHQIGFHPSRAAHNDPTRFRREFEALQASVPFPVKSGRQHYLHFRIPDTWGYWSDLGAEWESTMGYAEQEGFRCGICHDFPVFNLTTRQLEGIREKPLHIMDVTLMQYRLYTPEQASQSIRNVRQAVELHGGELVVLWHNSSWNDYIWGPWQWVLESLVKGMP